MILWISLGLFIISVAYYVIDAKLQPNREGKECVLDRVMGICGPIGFVGLLFSVVYVLAVLFLPFHHSDLSNITSKIIDSHNVNSTKTSVIGRSQYIICTQETTNGEYKEQEYNSEDIDIVRKKDIAPRIDVIQYSGQKGIYPWVAPFSKNEQWIGYRLYLPLEKSSYDID